MTINKITEIVDGKGDEVEIHEGYINILLAQRSIDYIITEDITGSWDDVEISGKTVMNKKNGD